MTQKYRTTCFADALVDYPGSLEDDPTWREEVVGFRLACDDDGNRGTRGGGWYDAPRRARVARRFGNGPGGRSGYLGFRLTVDWRHE